MPTLPTGGRSLTLERFDHNLCPNASSCDLSKLTFIDAYGLVATACALLASLGSGDPPPLRSPVQEQVRTHLALMGFGTLLEHLGYMPDLPVTSPPERPDVLVPLERFTSDFAAEQLSHLLWENLRREADPQVLNATLEGLWELAANAIEHSGAEAVIMGQVYRRGEPPDHLNRVQVVVGDAGRGIMRSLVESGRYKPRDDLEAIELALGYLVTSVDDPGRGQGLYTTMEWVTALQGKLVVRSGATKVTLESGPAGSERVPFLDGTIVCMSLPLG